MNINKHDFLLLVALKKDVTENIPDIAQDFGDIPNGEKRYLQSFLNNNSQFVYSQEIFNAHLGYVGMLFNEYVY